MGYIPVIVAGRIKGFKAALIFAALFFVIISLSGKVFSLEWTVFVFKGPVYGILFLYLLEKRVRFFELLLISSLPAIFYSLLLVFSTSLQADFRSLLEPQMKLLENNLGSFYVNSEEMLNYMIKFMPSAEIVQTLLTTSLLFIVINRKVVTQKNLLSNFKVPDWFVWVFAVALFLIVTGFSFQIGLNLLLIAAFIYSLQGVSVVRSFFRPSGQVLHPGEIIFYILQIFVWGVPVFLIGFLDNWKDFRSKMKLVREKNRDNKE